MSGPYDPARNIDNELYSEPRNRRGAHIASASNSQPYIHQTLRTAPAMAAGVTKRLWEMTDVVDVLEAFEAV